jgi:hypothetical protein
MTTNRIKPDLGFLCAALVACTGDHVWLQWNDNDEIEMDLNGHPVPEGFHEDPYWEGYRVIPKRFNSDPEFN